MEQTTPTCVGFIMDGNRRWAKARMLPTLEGHKRGADAFFEIVKAVRDAHILHAVFYAFSSENWNRSEQEVNYLMTLFSERIDTLNTKLAQGDSIEEKVRFRFIGDLSRFGQDLQEKIQKVEEETASYTDTTIWIALSYGGRAEILSAVNRAVEQGVEVSESDFRALLWSAEMSDPDLIIRTGGEKRLSNFMTWHAVYSELLFTDLLWPDMNRDTFTELLAQYYERKRNFGK